MNKGQKVSKIVIGTESVTEKGYVIIKTKEKKWEYKHRYIYQKYKGEIPPGYLIIFADKNNRNFEIDNLILISRKQAMILNKFKLISDDAELTKFGVNVANLIIKIGERKNE